MDGLKTGNAALKKANDMFSIDEIEQIMEDTAEAAEKQREITDMLSGQLSSSDEDEAMEELEQMLKEDGDKGGGGGAGIAGGAHRRVAKAERKDESRYVFA